MQAEGVVVRCEGARALVQVRRSGGCGRCDEPGGCGGSGAASCSEYLVSNPVGASSGQRVLIEVPEGSALRAAALAYGLPLAGVIGGAFAGTWCWGGGDAGSAAGGVGGLIVSLLFVRGLGPMKIARPRIAGILS